MNPLAPYMNMLKGFAALAVVAAFAFLYMQNQGLKEDKKNLAAEVGAKDAVIAQLTQTVTDIEREKEKLLAEAVVREHILVKNKSAIEKLRSDDKKHRIEIDRLKHEREEIRDYLDTVVDHAIIRLFREQERASGSEGSDLPEAAEAVNDGNAEALYTTLSIVNYALDLELALDSCNEDKRGLRDWLASVEELEGG